MGSLSDVKTITTEELLFLEKKYEEEKQKRVRQDGNAQYDELEDASSDNLKALDNDPWVDHERLNALPSNLKDGQDVKFLVLGGGFAGLLYTTHLVNAGFKASDMRIVDTAGGLGGTWYWNRYPGLACDVESSIYLPWLEETGYMPKHRYSYGDEIRRYMELVANKWQLLQQGVWRTRIEQLVWDDMRGRWVVSMQQDRGPKEPSISMAVTAQYVVLANGILNHPKAPKIDGIEKFRGKMMHTSRWDYSISGGSPTDNKLSGLEGKRVGIIGTGATGVQCSSEMAKWAKELYVFQRTASSVDARDQREMSREEWGKIKSKDGWWWDRCINFNAQISGDPHDEVIIYDAWSETKTMSMVAGAQHQQIPPADIPKHIKSMLAVDVPRSERMRRRVESLVTKNKETVEGLKAWYPTWCKRPTFHDNYLQIFNQDNVTLVQTEPKVNLSATEKGLVANGKAYELDILVFGTGFRAPSVDWAEPSQGSNTPIIGRNNLTLSEKWKKRGPGSLHGITTHGFPNLFLTGPAQIGLSGNVTHTYDILGRHAAYIVAEATKRTGGDAHNSLVIEPSQEAEDAYVNEILAFATFQAPMAVCLPNYRNNEGESMTDEDVIKATKATTYPLGVNRFAQVLEDWRTEGGMKGLTINTK